MKTLNSNNIINNIDKLNTNLLIMQTAVEQSASAIVITDAKGAIEYVNPKFIELTGYSTSELIGHNPKILQAGNTTKEQYQEMWHSLLETGEWQGQLKNKKKNGDIYWAHESISVVKNEAGQITNFLAVEDDITQRIVAENALIESEQRFRQMAEMTGEWLWEQDPEGYYIYSSNAVNTILGISPEQIIGKHYNELLTAEDKSDLQINSSLHKPFYALCNHYRHHNGQLVITESSGLPITNSEGKLIKWRGVDRDITSQKRSQDALIDSEKRTRLIIESALNAIVIMDSYGIISDWNHHAEKMFGWSKQQAIGQPLDHLIIPQRFQNQHRQGLKLFLRSGKGPILKKLLEQTAVRRDGTEFPVELTISPLKQGNAYIFSGFIHDITARKQTEHQIRQAQVSLAYAESEMNIARRIQSSLFPSAAIKTDDFEITGFCLPADRVGGDYFDYFFRDNENLDIVMADVSGHSIGPALFMVETRSAIRTQANWPANPAETLNVLNNFLYQDLDTSDYFITLFYLQYNPSNGQISFANAGHPPPLLLRQTKMECTELDADGLILGVRKNVIFEEKTLIMNSGDLILLYTDGLTEAENPAGDFFGIKPVCEILHKHAIHTPQTIIEIIIKQLKQFCQSDSFKDDVTLMIFKRT
ncbi:MAG: PAS domain S-box protein [Methylococcaceae bacterium]|nr:PAS domain S-box protein [Methylococcaceae bacterium]